MSHLSRREFMKVFEVVVVGAVIASCGGGKDTPTSTLEPSPTLPPAPQPPETSFLPTEEIVLPTRTPQSPPTPESTPVVIPTPEATGTPEIVVSPWAGAFLPLPENFANLSDAAREKWLKTLPAIPSPVDDVEGMRAALAGIEGEMINKLEADSSLVMLGPENLEVSRTNFASGSDWIFATADKVAPIGFAQIDGNPVLLYAMKEDGKFVGCLAAVVDKNYEARIWRGVNGNTKLFKYYWKDVVAAAAAGGYEKLNLYPEIMSTTLVDQFKLGGVKEILDAQREAGIDIVRPLELWYAKAREFDGTDALVAMGVAFK